MSVQRIFPIIALIIGAPVFCEFNPDVKGFACDDSAKRPCPGGFICLNNKCVEKPDDNGGGCPAAGCADGKVCKDGHCVADGGGTDTCNYEQGVDCTECEHYGGTCHGQNCCQFNTCNTFGSAPCGSPACQKAIGNGLAQCCGDGCCYEVCIY